MRQTFEEEYLDVLQNIEFVLISSFKQNPSMHDHDALRVIEALIRWYKTQEAGLSQKTPNLSTFELEVFAKGKDICALRLGDTSSGCMPPAIPTISIGKLLQCLKRIKKSILLWNRRHGAQGYLKFVSRFTGYA